MRDVRFFHLRGFGLMLLAIAAASVAGCADSRGGSIPYGVDRKSVV